MSIKEVAEAILQRDDFIISSHVNLEGDAVGSQLAFYILLKALGKNASVCNSEDMPDELKFLPYADHVNHNKEGFDEAGTAAVLDCSDLDRTGDIASEIEKVGFIINVDHHVSNTGFGDVNCVQGDSSSAGEIVYHLFKELKVDISKEAAECMYVSIVTDTGNFSYSNASSEAHKIVSELIKIGVKPEKINNNLKAHMEKRDIDALVAILNTLKVSDGGKVAYIVLSNDIVGRTGTRLVNSNYYIDYARFIKGVEVALFFREEDNGAVKVSFRSKGKVDVNKIAGLFGGGGHKAASGCTVNASLDDAVKQVLAKVEAVA